MAPPDLARDAPIPDILHPLKIGLLPELRHDSGAAFSDRLNGRLGQRLCSHKPLKGKIGLDDRLASVAVAYHVTVVFDFYQNTVSLKILNDPVSAIEAIQPSIRARILIHSARFINHLDLLETIL